MSQPTSPTPNMNTLARAIVGLFDATPTPGEMDHLAVQLARLVLSERLHASELKKAYDSGFDDGQTEAKGQNYEAGYNKGFEEGYNKGFDDGFDDGYSSGVLGLTMKGKKGGAA